MEIPCNNKKIKACFNIKYGENKRQSLDIYMPYGGGKYPVIFFVHGGAWSSGERKEYKNFGCFYARNGYVTILIDHRLSPDVSHPEHIKDVAKAFAWVKNNIKIFHGDDSEIYVCGHSSGAHLAALLTTNQKYLNEEGFDNSEIVSTIVISGIYNLGINVIVAGLGTIFPSSKDREDASPINFVENKNPPFLVIYAENEIISLRNESINFHKTLIKKKIFTKIKSMRGHDHYSIITSCATNSIASKTILNFMKGIHV